MHNTSEPILIYRGVKFERDPRFTPRQGFVDDLYRIG